MNTLLKAAAVLTLATTVATQAETSSDGISITFETGGKTVTVVVKDNNAKAYVGGKLIKSANFKAPNSSFNITDPTGKRLAHLNKFSTTYRQITKPRANLGINVGEPHSALASHLGLNRKAAVIVLTVNKGQAAEKAGIRKYDVIKSIDGKSPVTRKVLSDVIKKKKPGDTLRLQLVRKGKAIRVDVKLGSTGSVWGLYQPSTSYFTDALTATKTWNAARLPTSTRDWVTLTKPYSYKLYTPQELTGPWGNAKTKKPSSGLEGEIKKLRTELNRLLRMLDSLKKRTNVKKDR